MGIRYNTTIVENPTPFKRWCKRLAPAIFLIVLVLVAAWLVQRSMNTPSRQRRLQAWLDENLNADVSLLSSMRVRLNLLRNSRLYVNGLEVEHPMPIFPGKFIRMREVISRAPFYSIYRLSPGKLDLAFWQLKIGVEQNEFGEWSSEGFMSPLSRREVEFPFFKPLVSGFEATFRESELTVRRRGFEMNLQLALTLDASFERSRAIIRCRRAPFTLTHIESGQTFPGHLSTEGALTKFALLPDGSISLQPENCEFHLENLSCSALPFFFSGLPAEVMPGTFSGLLRLINDPEGGILARLEGELRDAPLAMFGLPPTAPFRMELPLGESRAERVVSIRLGPSGYGGFDLKLPLNERGAPKLLELHSDIVSVEDLAKAVAGGAGWPGWFSSVLPAITWQAGKWRGFGWEGDAFHTSLSRSTTGLNLLAEGEMLGGRVKAAMNPTMDASPAASVAADRLDAKQLAARLARIIPAAWLPALADGRASLTWRGSVPGAAGNAFWNLGFVLVKPEIVAAESGEWWRTFFDLPNVLVADLPQWGGGDPAPLLALLEQPTISLDQISIVGIRDDDTGCRVEFVAQTVDSGEIGGWIDFYEDGRARGELFMVGISKLLVAATEANPRLGRVLDMLSGTPEGLRVEFTHDADNGVRFAYPFLKDAGRIARELESMSEEGDGQ